MHKLWIPSASAQAYYGGLSAPLFPTEDVGTEFRITSEGWKFYPQLKFTVIFRQLIEKK